MENYVHLRKAYVKRLREKPGMNGTITVKFVINKFGSVISAELIESNMRDPALEKTVLQRG
jgi:outer membrane biosynthesis protein TonB